MPSIRNGLSFSHTLVKPGITPVPEWSHVLERTRRWTIWCNGRRATTCRRSSWGRLLHSCSRLGLVSLFLFKLRKTSSLLVFSSSIRSSLSTNSSSSLPKSSRSSSRRTVSGSIRSSRCFSLLKAARVSAFCSSLRCVCVDRAAGSAVCVASCRQRPLRFQISAFSAL